MPQVISFLAVAIPKETGNVDFYSQSCLINHYNQGKKLGMHRNNTEENLSAPIILIFLGNTSIFVLGGKLRTDDTKQYIVQSGDVIVMGGESRNYFHSLKGIILNASNLLLILVL